MACCQTNKKMKNNSGVEFGKGFKYLNAKSQSTEQWKIQRKHLYLMRNFSRTVELQPCEQPEEHYFEQLST